jgi:hypothetical protein
MQLHVFWQFLFLRRDQGLWCACILVLVYVSIPELYLIWYTKEANITCLYF